MKEGEKIDRQIHVYRYIDIHICIQNEREINNYIYRESKRKKRNRKKERERQRFMNRKKQNEKEKSDI